MRSLRRYIATCDPHLKIANKSIRVLDDQADGKYLNFPMISIKVSDTDVNYTSYEKTYIRENSYKFGSERISYSYTAEDAYLDKYGDFVVRDTWLCRVVFSCKLSLTDANTEFCLV